MIASPPPILQPRTLSDTHWLSVLREHLAQAREEHRRELVSPHPGARHRVLHLLLIGRRLSAQIAAMEAARATVARVQGAWSQWPKGGAA